MAQKKPSVSMPKWMLEEIEDRRQKGTNRSEYIREAVETRFDLEDSGEWESDSGSEVPEQPAD